MTCHCCDGKKSFPAPDIKALIDALFTTRGKVRKFRKSFPSNLQHWNDLFGGRCYFVWRMARFHGGADVTMPVVADMVTRGDPYVKELEAVAEIVARKVFGTDMAAAYRWGRAFGMVDRVPEGQPPSAHEGGPVADEDKPWWEMIELK